MGHRQHLRAFTCDLPSSLHLTGHSVTESTTSQVEGTSGSPHLWFLWHKAKKIGCTQKSMNILNFLCVCVYINIYIISFKNIDVLNLQWIWFTTQKRFRRAQTYRFHCFHRQKKWNWIQMSKLPMNEAQKLITQHQKWPHQQIFARDFDADPTCRRPTNHPTNRW